MTNTQADINKTVFRTDRSIDRQTNRQIDRQKHKFTVGVSDIVTDGRKDIKWLTQHRERERERERETYTSPHTILCYSISLFLHFTDK